MKRITLPAVLLSLLVSAAPALAQSAPTAVSRLVVVGSGTVDRMPDQAIVSFTIQTDDADAARAASHNNAIYSVLGGKVRAMGLSASALKTTGYSLSYNPRPPVPNPQVNERYGYIVSRTATVTTPRTDQAGAIVDAGVAAGVTSVGEVSFGIRDDRAAYRAAQAAAVADAEAQARSLAEAAHVRAGRILEIAPQEYTPTPPRPLIMARMAAAAPAVPTDIQPSDLTVRATVTMTFAIAP